ncbi:MAG: hypothetical protein WC889_07775 [Myxococcota bacterium]|jgi:hypothetical protein
MNQGKVIVISTFLAGLILAAGCSERSVKINPDPSTAVTIKDKGNYYRVSMDYYGSGASPWQMGVALGTQIKKVLPEYEKLVDTLLVQVVNDIKAKNPGVSTEAILSRVKAIKPQIDKKYRDEIEGLASTFSGGDSSQIGDGTLSADKLYLLNLLPDFKKTFEGTAVSAYGEFSGTGSTFTGMAMDVQSFAELPRLQAVTYIDNSGTPAAIVGYLGMVTTVVRGSIHPASSPRQLTQAETVHLPIPRPAKDLMPPTCVTRSKTLQRSTISHVT